MNTEALEDISDPFQKAARLFVPSSPIREATRLFGRAEQLKRVERELLSPGRCVFIFGDRGVGKTSLAQTAAYLVNRASEEPIFVSCYGATFSKVIVKIARDLMRLPYYQDHRRKDVKELKLGGAACHILARIETEPTLQPTVEPFCAVDLINEIAPESESVVVVVDEVDQAGAGLKKDLAHFVKELGDRDCPVKFVFTGIANDVNDLLHEHESAFRGIASVRLERLMIGDLMEITSQGFKCLGITVPDMLQRRMAMLSDGFAYFTHLLALRLAERAIDDRVNVVGVSELEAAVAAAVESSEVYLRSPYEKAVRKYQNHELILWALADHYLMDRQYKDIYQSYLDVCKAKFRSEGRPFVEPNDTSSFEDDGPEEEREEEPADVDRASALTVFTKAQFSNALQRLKNESHGSVIESPRGQRGWYRFSIPMLRGYCRIVAARQGVQVGLQYLDSRRQLKTGNVPAGRI